MQVKERTEESVFSDTLLSSSSRFEKGISASACGSLEAALPEKSLPRSMKSSNKMSVSRKICSGSVRSSARRARSARGPQSGCDGILGVLR